MNNPSAPIEAVSSQRSEEIQPKAGIATPNTRGQFAPKEKFMVDGLWLMEFVESVERVKFEFRNKKV